MPTPVPTPIAPQPVQAPASAPTVLEEPQAGGSYLRDPVTGALSLAPASTPLQEPQE